MRLFLNNDIFTKFTSRLQNPTIKNIPPVVKLIRGDKIKEAAELGNRTIRYYQNYQKCQKKQLYPDI